MNDILRDFDPITLEEMSGIRLMNRTDTKFVTTVPVLRQLLRMAKSDYRVQEVEGERISPYYTVYFDTPRFDMYRRHETGRAWRQKLRIRSYVSSRLNFLEVKTKNNHGRTQKKRVRIGEFNACCPDHGFSPSGGAYADFLSDNLIYRADTLRQCIENRFDRITLVNRQKTERLTIDTSLTLNNLVSGCELALPDLVIIELKRDGLAPSPILGMLRRLRVKPMGFSKYCIGSALTNPLLPQGQIKRRLRTIAKLAALYSDNTLTKENTDFQDISL